MEYYYQFGVNDDLIVVLKLLLQSSTDMRAFPAGTADLIQIKVYRGLQTLPTIVHSHYLQ
jgi:hypothetical protein